MSIRSEIELLFTRHVAELTECADFQALESGQASPENYTHFVENVVRSHLQSPQLLAFLFSLAPPDVAANLQHNMLEELGIEEDSGIAHPSLLKQLAVGAGLTHRLPELEALAAADIRQVVVDPLLYGTLKEVGLAALWEITAFEFMLSRVAGRIARALAAHHGLSSATLQWFTHHSEVDIQHAEQGLDNLAAYIRYYEFSEENVLTILEMTLRENVFIKRYFGELSRGRSITEVES
jgi:pyrroloquinoline quinone (PQQ) biosynthesis protein C